MVERQQRLAWSSTPSRGFYTTTADRSRRNARPSEGQRLPRRSYPLRGTIHLAKPARAFYAGNFFGARRAPSRIGRIDMVRESSTSEQTTPQSHAARSPGCSSGGDLVRCWLFKRRNLGAQLSRAERRSLLAFDAHPLAQPLVELARPGWRKPSGSRACWLRAWHFITRRYQRDRLRAEHSKMLCGPHRIISRTGRRPQLPEVASTCPSSQLIIAETGLGCRSHRDRADRLRRRLQVNAVRTGGGGGRAGRETEGWLILAEQRQFHTSQFDPLGRHQGDDLEVRSRLTADDALVALATFEQLVATSEDAVLADLGASNCGIPAHSFGSLRKR